MNQIDAMRIYVRVAELASFTLAADSLGLPKSSVSTAIRDLETDLGTRLLHRTTRKVGMTQDGQAFFERARDMLADLDELQAMFQHDETELSGRLRVDMPAGVAAGIVVPRLGEFLADHPRLELELSSTDRRVDLVREGFDCVLRVGHLSDSALIARPLGHFRQINCASPAYLARYGVPRNLEDLAGHRLIHYVTSLGSKSPGFEYQDGGQPRRFAMAGAITVNGSDAYEAACLAGLGIIQVPDMGLGAMIAEGRLVEVLPEYRAAPLPVSLLIANRRHLPRRTRRFMAWIAEIMRPFVR